MSKEVFDVAILGGGPAGYVCAIKCAQLGMRVACIERRKYLGGTCLNEGCIPSKTLLNSSYMYYTAKKDFEKLGIKFDSLSFDLTKMMQNKQNVLTELGRGIDFLFKKNKISLFCGVGRITSCDSEVKELCVDDGQTVFAKKIVIATGSNTAQFLDVKFDEDVILSSAGALQLSLVPKTLVVVGAGAIGLEMASIWSRLGSDVTVVEYADRIATTCDIDVSAHLIKSLKKQGVKFHTSSKIEEIAKKEDGSGVEIKFAKAGDQLSITAEKVLIAVGRRPNTEGIGVELETDLRGFVKVDDKFMTNLDGVYAVGDVIAGPMLAHKAEEEGVAVAEVLAGGSGHIGWIPSVIYTHPEVASVGKTEQEVKEIGINYKSSKFPFSANSRAKTNNDTDGFVKIIVDEFDTILGVHIIGPNASTIIAEAVVAMEYGASAEDLARTCHSHPDLNEAVKEAALGAFFKPIHS